MVEFKLDCPQVGVTKGPQAIKSTSIGLPAVLVWEIVNVKFPDWLICK